MAAFPPPPVDTIDWSNIGFTIREVHGHIESTFSRATGQWTPLKFVADPYMRIHGMAPALNYGQQAYEGLKAFRMPPPSGITTSSSSSPSDITLFRPDRNAARMQHSADVASMPRVPKDMFLAACRAAVALNAAFVPPHDSGAALYVRPQLYGASAQLGLAPPAEYTFAVFVVPTGVYHGMQPVRALILDEFDRTAPRGTGHAKIGGNYAPVWRWSERARAEGYGITLHLDSARHEEIDEFSSSAFIGVVAAGKKTDEADKNREGQRCDDDDAVTIVVPDSSCVIDSITSASVVDLARSWGWTVEKRAVRYDELPRFTEVMAAGTAAALVSIRSITRRQRGVLAASGAANVTTDTEADTETVTYIPDEQDEAGPICRKLLASLQGIQLGREEDVFGWRFRVGKEDMEVQGAPVARKTEAMSQTVDQWD